MRLRTVWLLVCCSVCASALAVQEGDVVTDPMDFVNVSFHKLKLKECATALLCLWLELVQLPRKRMIERIDMVFQQVRSTINVTKERAMLEKDETFTNLNDARVVLRTVHSKLKGAELLNDKLNENKVKLLNELAKEGAVVGQVNNALLAISTAALVVYKYNDQLVSLSNVKRMVMERNNFSLGQQIATNATELIVKTWWNKNTSFLIQNLQTLINESSDICSKHAENMKQQSWISRYTNRTYSDVIRLASSGRSDLVKYMETVGSVDGLDGRHRNVSASLVKLLPTGNVSRIINATARDIVELQEIKTQLQKEKVRYVVMVQREREEARLGGCTGLWKQFLTFVGWE
ncbi:hypothetical protein ERJ75_001311900 [Trypanosoma vivax]|nr:hypothetical protein ERJ75_001311900 [Trypanosoma vivax]